MAAWVHGLGSVWQRSANRGMPWRHDARVRRVRADAAPALRRQQQMWHDRLPHLLPLVRRLHRLGRRHPSRSRRAQPRPFVLPDTAAPNFPVQIVGVELSTVKAADISATLSNVSSDLVDLGS